MCGELWTVCTSDNCFNSHYAGYSAAGQGNASMGCLHWTGLHSEEHGDLTEGGGGAAEPSHPRPALGAADAGHTGEGAGATYCPLEEEERAVECEEESEEKVELEEWGKAVFRH